MPQCKNDPSRSYKGNEPSPKGRGYCAHTEDIGKKRKGTDRMMWEVKKFGKVKRWMKLTGKNKSKETKSGLLLDTWMTGFSAKDKTKVKKLCTGVKKNIEKEDILVEIIPNHISPGGFYWVDYPWDKMSEIHGNNYLKKDFVIIVLPINSENRLDLQGMESIFVQNNLSAKGKKVVDKVFKKDLGKDYTWNKRESKTIVVKI